MSKSPQIYPLSLKVACNGAAGDEAAADNDEFANSGADFHVGDDASKADGVGAGAAAGREQLEGGVCGVAGGQYVFDEAGVASRVGVIDQLDGAGTGDQAADKGAEGVAVIGDIQGFLGGGQAPAAGANDGGVSAASCVELNRTLFASDDCHGSESLDGFKGHTDLGLEIALGSW